MIVPLRSYFVLILLFGLYACGPSQFEVDQARITSEIKTDIQTLRESGKKLAISSSGAHGPDYAGGVKFGFAYRNLTNKTIKYVDFWVKPYNAVGDVQYDSITKRATMQVVDTGPIAPNGVSGGVSTPLWYNHSITCLVIVKLRIRYVDGTSKTYTGNKGIKELMLRNVTNSC